MLVSNVNFIFADVSFYLNWRYILFIDIWIRVDSKWRSFDIPYTIPIR